MEFIQLLEPWMIPIIIMICVTIIVAVSVIGNIITTSMKRKDGKDLSENKEFINALREFKENIDQRVANLEDVVHAERKRNASLKANEGKKTNMQSAIELELDEEKTQEQDANESSKLRNMLNQ
ncbi:hypothetical protein [Rhodohalobacter sp. 614A]|uniref:hypothetical protein n=1 Tax=Rhodohalobacter sp. 614A TaxID=2908649 RepID=UPI001F16E040|nr:hypothetical protein [Rhodohalobacter sp. 614A]